MLTRPASSGSNARRVLGKGEHSWPWLSWRRPAGQQLSVRLLLSTVVLAVAYFLTARLGSILGSIASVSAIWPAAGIGLAGLLIAGTRTWPVVAVAAFVEIFTNALDKASPIEAAALAVVQTGALYVDVRLLRVMGFDRGLSRVRDVLALVTASGVGSLVAATSGSLVMLLDGFLTADHFPLAVLVWFVGDALGLLTVVPLLLALRSVRAIPTPRASQVSEATMFFLALVTTSVLLCRSSLPLVFLIFPFTWWGAFRFGVLGAAVANLAVTVVSVWMTVSGYGPFAHLPSTLQLVSLQTFNASVTVASLLLATAVSERWHALEDVRASRARLVEAADTERRRLERDLHDGVQQHLVKLSVNLGHVLARTAPSVSQELRGELSEMLADLTVAHEQLRTLARGIHPAVLTQEGLSAALESLADQAPLPVVVTAPRCRCSPTVEATAYFVVSEAIANAARHAEANYVTVSIHTRHDRLIVEVTDDGVGGADPTKGTGLTGLSDRAAALGGELVIESPRGGGTRLHIELPSVSP